MRKIRYITGRGGDAKGGLSAHLETLTEDYGALAVNHAFLQQSFLDQVSTVRKFCITEHCNIIACSYGAYLLLHALIDQPPLEELRERFTWFDGLYPVRRDAVIDMNFNLGITRLSKFQNMIAALSELRFSDAATEALDSKLARQVGQRAQTVAAMLRTGERQL